MNRHVNAIAGRLSLRAPQRRSLEILDRITEIAPPRKGVDIAAALEIIHSEFSSVTDFEREFPSLCFALATGVGKTRLMGAFISYLHLAHGINNFFVLAPNLTIYNKLITDFSDRTHPKYVFKGISVFAIDAPIIITGDNCDQSDPASGTLFGGVRINIFNISKINSEVRGGKAPRIKRLSEYIGESYFDYLAGLPDLVLLMDESHRYRASAGIKAINELRPVLGLETKDAIYMLEPKVSNQMTDPIVLAQKEAAIKWCKNASDYALVNGGKTWRYVLIPHNAIALNMTLAGLADRFAQQIKGWAIFFRLDDNCSFLPTPIHAKPRRREEKQTCISFFSCSSQLRVRISFGSGLSENV